MLEDEDLLLAVLNSAPVLDGVPTDQLDDGELPGRFGGSGTRAERQHLQRTRNALHGMIRAEPDAIERLTETVGKTVLLPEITPDGIHWRLDVPAAERLSARTVLAWSRVVHTLPGRLRACANTECNLFLIDHSRPGTAKWCSMATCGNRIKVRAHARRSRGS